MPRAGGGGDGAAVRGRTAVVGGRGRWGSAAGECAADLPTTSLPRDGGGSPPALALIPSAALSIVSTLGPTNSSRRRSGLYLFAFLIVFLIYICESVAGEGGEAAGGAGERGRGRGGGEGAPRLGSALGRWWRWRGVVGVRLAGRRGGKTWSSNKRSDSCK